MSVVIHVESRGAMGLGGEHRAIPGLALADEVEGAVGLGHREDLDHGLDGVAAVKSSTRAVSTSERGMPPATTFSDISKLNALTAIGLSGRPTMHNLPCGRNAATYTPHGRSADTVLRMKSNLPGRSTPPKGATPPPGMNESLYHGVNGRSVLQNVGVQAIAGSYDLGPNAQQASS